MKHSKEAIKMKKNILLFLMSFVFAVAENSELKPGDKKHCCIDQRHFYVRFLSGPNFLQSSTTDGNKSTFKPGYIIDGLLGYSWPCGLRLEAEYAFRRNGIKKIDFYVEGCSCNGHFQTSSCMANLLWDLSVSSWGCAFCNIQLFIGVGLGYDFQQMHSWNSRIIFNQKWNNLSWQTMAGLTYPIFCNTDIAFEYKFHQGGPFYNHYVGIGLVYTFGFFRLKKTAQI